MPNIYTKDTLEDVTKIRSIDYTLASPSGLHKFSLAMIDWRTNHLVHWQLDFFQATVARHSNVESLRLAFVREQLPQQVWSDLTASIASLPRLRVLCVSHMRCPWEIPLDGVVPYRPFVDEVLRVSPHSLFKSKPWCLPLYVPAWY